MKVIPIHYFNPREGSKTRCGMTPDEDDSMFPEEVSCPKCIAKILPNTARRYSWKKRLKELGINLQGIENN